MCIKGIERTLLIFFLLFFFRLSELFFLGQNSSHCCVISWSGWEGRVCCRVAREQNAAPLIGRVVAFYGPSDGERMSTILGLYFDFVWDSIIKVLCCNGIDKITLLNSHFYKQSMVLFCLSLVLFLHKILFIKRVPKHLWIHPTSMFVLACDSNIIYQNYREKQYKMTMG